CIADQFIRQATLPTYERGTRGAQTVVAVMDGAPWLQDLIDEQCPDAVRIIDFAHAVSYLSGAAQATFGAGSREAAIWLDAWVPVLKRGEPEAVLAAIRGLPAAGGDAATAKGTAIRYLGSRTDQLRYATFVAAGYPIGSGIVESAGKLVVEARMKGSGMHWSPQQITPLLALRGRLCSGQWTETWRGIWQAWRAQVRHRQREARRWRQAEQARKRAAEAPAQPGSSPKRERTKAVVNGTATE